jgi:hypothetical protein
MVRCWLDQADAERLEKIAAERNIDVPTLVADTLYPLLDAQGQGVRMFTVTLEPEDVRRMRGIIERLCSEEPEPVDADAEIPKWLQVYVNTGIDDDSDSK